MSIEMTEHDKLYYNTALEVVNRAETIRDFGDLSPIKMETVWQETTFQLKGIAEVAINDNKTSYGLASEIHKLREAMK